MIEKYLGDSRTAVVRAAMVSLIRLNSEKYLSQIIEMLGDSRVGIVKVAQQLIIKYGVPDYNRIQEIFHSTEFEYVKIKCVAILLSAPKWQSLIYMLEALSCTMEDIRKLTIQAIDEWLFKFNKSFTEATMQQKETARQLIDFQGELLPPSVKKELLFVLR